MKVTSKPISSPGRTERFPTPLMLRFLRSNVGSRSRGRSRSSPMFVGKKNAVIEPSQEPSSPKVTCMGQVRVRRSSKNSGSKTDRTNRSQTPAKRRPRWWLFRKAVFCHHFGKFHKLRSFRPFGFSRLACCRKFDFGLESSRIESNRRSLDKADDVEVEDEDKDVGEEDDAAQVRGSKEGFLPPSPPKNALLLTRCRSAPYRSSSLASQFWGSPLSTTETGDNKDDEAKKGLQQQQGDREMESPSLESDSNYKQLALEERTGEEMEGSLKVSKEFDEKSNGRSKEENKFDEMTARGGGSVHPLTLTRCKSEPARRGERLNPEGSSWIQRRLELPEPFAQT